MKSHVNHFDALKSYSPSTVTLRFETPKAHLVAQELGSNKKITSL